jgi:hypothetical protein
MAGDKIHAARPANMSEEPAIIRRVPLPYRRAEAADIIAIAVVPFQPAVRVAQLVSPGPR